MVDVPYNLLVPANITNQLVPNKDIIEKYSKKRKEVVV